MALIFADRVKETTTSTGTGPLTLAGAVAGFEPFSAVCADGDTAYYCVTDGTSWEVGLGTYASGVLTRTSVLSSSNAGAAVALNPGSKEVHLDVPAAVVSAGISYVGPASGLPTGRDGQFALLSDSPGPTFFYALLVWDAGDWQTVTAVDVSRSFVNSHAGILATTGSTSGQIAFASDQSYKPYVWNGGSWQDFIATDATARAAAASAASDAAAALGTANDANAFAGTMYPVFSSGTPAATSQPTDGTVVNYFDTSTTPASEWVFDGTAWQQITAPSSPVSDAGYFRVPVLTGLYSTILPGGTTTLVPAEAVENVCGLFIPQQSGTIVRLSINVTSAGAAGSVVRLGMRAYDAANNKPGALIVDGGTVVTTGTGVKEVTISQAVTAGVPFVITATCQGAAATRPTLTVWNAASWPQAMALNSTNFQSYTKASVTGALDNTGTWVTANGATPKAWIRA